ncbi:MAG: sodium-dependent transporter [Planctomycetota bacterium]
MDYTLKSVVNFSKPIQEEADLEGLELRASAADIQALRLDLAQDAGERDAPREIDRTRNTVRPSVWRAHEQYATALAEAGVVDVFHVETIQKVWGQEPRARIEAWGFAGDVDRKLSTAHHSEYEQARARLFEKPGFEDKVAQALSLLEEIEQERKAALLAALADYESMPEHEVRTEAEDAARRRHTRERVEAAFGAVAGDGWMSLFWTSIFMTITIVIVAGGIARGIERACLILMPALFGLLLVFVVYGMFQRGFGEAVSFVFKPDATKLQPSGVLGALGQAFFSLSLGMGAMITYGSYQRTKQQLVGQSITIAGLDTAVALLACLMIFPIVFSFGQEPAQGPGLLFMSMPLAFAEIGKAGMLLATIFFGLLVFAALTSSISLLEVVASYLIDERGWSRPKSVWLIGGMIFLFAVPSAFATDGDFAMGGWAASYGTDFFSTMDYLATNWMLPLGGCLIAVYAGWVMPQQLRSAELQGLAPAFFAGWLALVRFVAPAMVILILLQSIGILDADELLHGLFHGGG